MSNCRQVMAPLLIALAASWIAVCSPVTGGPESDEFQPLFDGKTLNGWRGYHQAARPPSWSIEEGQIRGTGEGPDLMTVATFTDFDFRCEWNLAPGGNSGVIYRVTEAGEQPYHSGPEYQVLDDRGLEQEVPSIHAAGAVYGLYGAKADKTLKPAGEFNTTRIVARGNHLEHWLNGEKVAECEIGSDDWNQKTTASKFQAWPIFARSAGGHIALQAHGSSVWYRNLRIRPLAPQASP